MDDPYFYDKTNIYPYLCIHETDRSVLKNVVQLLTKERIRPLKFYKNPSKAASNGIRYKYLFRLPFIATDPNIKPDDATVIRCAQQAFAQVNAPTAEENNELSAQIFRILEEEKRFLKTIHKSLTEERDFLKEQIQELKQQIIHIREENERIVRGYDRFSENIIQMLAQDSDKKTHVETRALEAELQKQTHDLQQREERLRSREKDLEKSYEKKVIEVEKRLLQKETEFKGLINDLKRENEKHYFGIDMEKPESPHVLIFGQSALNKSQIAEIYEDMFEQGNWDIDLNRLECLCLKYNEAKRANLMEKLKHNHYDAVILGPHPHSTLGRDLNEGVDTIVKKQHPNCRVFKDMKSPLSKSRLQKFFFEINHTVQ